MREDPNMSSEEQTLVEASASKRWIRAVGLGSGARIFALGSQFVVLILMSRILAKDVFGEMMIVFALYRLISLGLGTGFGNMILYHIGRSGGDEALDIRLHRTVTLYGMTLSIAIAVGCFFFSAQIADLFGKPGMTVWLQHLSPFVVFSTLNTIAMGSLDGRSQITSSIVMNEVVPNGLRLCLLPLVALFSLAPVAVAHIIWISVALPWVVAALPLMRSSVSGFEKVDWWDLRYAGLYALNTIASQQLQGIDMLVVGALFNSEAAAGYAISSRIATLFPFFQQIILRNFAPRAGFLLSAGDTDTLNRELLSLKNWSIIAVNGLTGAILISAPIVFSLFGDYISAVPILVVLAAPFVVRSLYAGNDVMLRMSGSAGFGLVIAVASAALVVLTPMVTQHALGIYSVAAGMLISALILNPFTSIRLARDGFELVNRSDIPLIVFGLASVVLGAILSDPYVAGFVSGGGLLVAAAAALVKMRGRD